MTTPNEPPRIIDHSKNPWAVPCPSCGRKMAPTIHGYPSPELMEASRKGWVGLGGCIPPMTMSEDIRSQHCDSCANNLAPKWEFIERLSEAHDIGWNGYGSTLEIAMSELAAGRKKTHWIWYVFPQIRLGSSPASHHFAVPNREAAIMLLDDETLGARYRLAVDAVTAHVLDGRGDRSAWDALVALMGSRLDAKKFVSSITLFGEVARIAGKHLDVAERLDRFAATGIRPCSSTLDAIVAGKV